MTNYIKKKLFRFKYRRFIFHSKFLDQDIMIIKVRDWDDWTWEIAYAVSNHRFGHSDYDVRDFVKHAQVREVF